MAMTGRPPLSDSSTSISGETGADAVGVCMADDADFAIGVCAMIAPFAIGVGVDVAVGEGVGVADGVGCGVDVADGVAVGCGIGVDVAVGCAVAVGCGLGVAVGVGCGVAVGCGLGVAVGVGCGVAVGSGAAVAVGSGVGSGVAVGVEVGVGVAAAACAMVIAYRLKFVSVVVAHALPSASVSQRCSSGVHAPPETRYIRAMPFSQADSSPGGRAKRKSTPSGYAVSIGDVPPILYVFRSTASATRSSAFGAAKSVSPSFLRWISNLSGAAPGGRYRAIVESGLSSDAEDCGDTAVLAESAPVMVKVAGRVSESSSPLSWAMVI